MTRRQPKARPSNSVMGSGEIPFWIKIPLTRQATATARSQGSLLRVIYVLELSTIHTVVTYTHHLRATALVAASNEPIRLLACFSSSALVSRSLLPRLEDGPDVSSAVSVGGWEVQPYGLYSIPRPTKVASEAEAETKSDIAHGGGHCASPTWCGCGGPNILASRRGIEFFSGFANTAASAENKEPSLVSFSMSLSTSRVSST